MATESLYNSIHKKGKHGYGGLWGGPGGSWHHNILAHHTSRNPRASGNVESGLLDYRNNVIYNWGFQSAYGGELWPRNWVNNYYKYGPATDPKVKRRIFYQTNARDACTSTAIMSGAFRRSARTIGPAASILAKMATPPKRLSESRAVRCCTGAHSKRGRSFRARAEKCRCIAVARFGRFANCRRNTNGHRSFRTFVRRRRKRHHRFAVGRWWLARAQVEAGAVDTDGDGMPDDWERSQGLNPKRRPMARSTGMAMVTPTWKNTSMDCHHRPIRFEAL